MRKDEKEAQGLYDHEAERYIKASADLIDVLELRDMMQIIDELDLLHGQILEAGAGSGQLTRLILEQPGDFEILALDQNIALLRKLIEVEDKRLGVRLTSFYNLAICDHSFDLAVSNFALNYAQDLDQVLQEISRSLVVGGYLLFSSVMSSANDRQKLSSMLVTSQGNLPVFAYRFDEKQIRRCLKDAGFHVTRLNKYSPQYWVVDPVHAKEGISAHTFVCLAQKIF